MIGAPSAAAVDASASGPALIRALVLFPIAILIAARPSPGGNQALVTGAYGGSLGAGGATSAERSGFGQNPAALRPGLIGAHAHFHRPFGMDELQVAEAGIFADAVRFGAAFDWRETGVKGLYVEQAIRAGQTLRLGGQGGVGSAGSGFPGGLDLGLSWERWQATWPGGKTGTSWSHGFGMVWRMLPRFQAGAFVSGLALEPSGSHGMDRVLQWGLEAASRDPDHVSAETSSALQVVRLDFRKTGETPWRILASLSLCPHPSVEFTGGLANPPFQASLGIRFAWQGAEWHQALRYHRYLGRTWLSGLAYSSPWGSRRIP